MMRNATTTLLAMTLPLVLAACGRAPRAAESGAEAPNPGPTAMADGSEEAVLLARGKYLTVIGGCNDCHSPGYAESGGQTPESQWLLGSPLGWSGPWGTTYPANLRLKAQGMDEAAWLAYTADLHTRPPMPDFAVRAMEIQDRRALYRFIRSLGAAGNPAPAYLPPGRAPSVPYVKWVLPAPPAAVAEGS